MTTQATGHRVGVRSVAAIAALLLAVALVPGTRASGAPTGPAPITLKVMEFNIEYGGFRVSWDATLEVLERADADVVAIEEGYGRVDALARDGGWPYFSERLQLLSRFPIVDPPDGGGLYAFIEVAPGHVVAIQNVHLPSSPYGPFRIMQGETREEVLDHEREVRIPALEPYLEASAPLIGAGIPTFLVGDFNAPSWRDWTPRMVGVRPQIEYVVRWPVSRLVEAVGFTDSYRAVHPNPLRDPGITWPAERPDVPGWDPGKNAPADRIDLIYSAWASPIDSITIGAPGDEGVDMTVDPWPTDHRAVMSTFDVTPAPMPVLVAVPRPLVPVGAELEVRFHTDGAGAPWSIALVPVDGDPVADALATSPTTAGSDDGTVAFDTASLEPGSYEAVLLDQSGTERSRISFWVKAPGTGPRIETTSPTYRVGEPIEVHWTNAQALRWDWVGIYRRNRDPMIRWYLLWTYTGATVEGTAILNAKDHGNRTWPLEPGRYSVYLLRDDSYRKMAQGDFEIIA